MGFWESVEFWAAKCVVEVALGLILLCVVAAVFALLTPKDKR